MEPVTALPKARQPTINKGLKDDLLKFFQKATFFGPRKAIPSSKKKKKLYRKNQIS
jgi:hypothetical protein